MNKPTFSVIIPVRIETEYLKQTLSHLSHQTYTSYEVLVITDRISQTANPAQKRNLGAKMAKGKYLAFLDDDSYPNQDWLKNALAHLKNKKIAAVCGPCLTPPEDDIYQQASGLVWESLLGSGGAGSYRNRPATPRFVDDYPSVNLIVKKKDFIAINGFDTHHWPGEDTILCLNLVYQLHKKILYHPSIVVYHHRRQVITAHLKQITRYATHRGNFARTYPKTSLRVGYLVPSFFCLYLLLLPFVSNFKPFLIPLIFYSILLLSTFVVFCKKHSLTISLLATITIPITHVYYGILFIIGFFTPKLAFNPHQVDTNKSKYIGG